MGNDNSRIYENLAFMYDDFMEETPYEKWVEFVEKIYEMNNQNPKLVLELACGTGTITKIMKNKGYDMIGVDNSEEMLSIAKSKDSEILYLQQDMEEFELYGTVDSIICLCDGMNYMLTKKSLQNVLKLCENYLNPNGILIFDMNTKYYFKNVLQGTFSHLGEDNAYICESFYDKKSRINEYITTMFSKTDGNNYEKTEEYQQQRAYSIKTVEELIKNSNLELTNIYSDLTFDEPTKKTSRYYYVCRKQGEKTENE